MYVPEHWADFFTYMLLSPNKFDWAKGFLSGKAWECCIKEYLGPVVDFQLPQNCPVSAPPCCNTSMINVDSRTKLTLEEQTPDDGDVLQYSSAETNIARKDTKHDFSSPTANQETKKQSMPPLVDTDVRRSTRL